MDIKSISENESAGIAMRHLAEHFDQFVNDVIRLTEVASPPFHEQERASTFFEMIKDVGIERVSTDDIGNVLAFYPGCFDSELRRTVCVAAHLDTVFPAGTDTSVRRDGNRLYAPGVGDDTRGLAVLIALARAIVSSRLKTGHNVLFVANVGEEGAGNLRGVRHLFLTGEWSGKVDAFVSIDGPDMETVISGAIGSTRYRIMFSGPGGHSFLDFGVVNPANALGRFLGNLASLSLSSMKTTTVSANMLSGGTSINAIPREVWVEVDLRSTDAIALRELDETVRNLVEDAVSWENSRGDVGKGSISAWFHEIGNRPAAALIRTGYVVDESVRALEAYGFNATLDMGSTDANIPLSLGIPAVAIGSGFAGGNLHTLDEWIDVEAEPNQRALFAILTAVLSIAEISS